MLSQLTTVCSVVDEHLTRTLNATEFTRQLIITPTSKFITESLLVLFFIVINYEIVYWSGIHLGLWEYHARHIFKEIPVHCAHVYVRINVVTADDTDQLNNYYSLKRQSKRGVASLTNWSKMTEEGQSVFQLPQFVKYHLEFSPEDFESSQDPEYGCTVDHLRKRVLELWNESDLYSPWNQPHHPPPKQVVVYSNKDVEVTKGDEYLSKVDIETGNVIDVVVVVEPNNEKE
ncbi:hypothetical protein DIURU_003864 [Diutina rugosa]|uniref:Uncharacterized protein n=1 Tax=Diutina rugosa TaxID=5481 RepID=A0A642UJQ3_DIURU|nr:uncharacterized protein DIURU_003864 [Diutina rugosa]KAA8900283.1 hypothetical protein DIURU_003864 [Diutina rugosa]